MTEKEIIEKFLEDNIQFLKVEWEDDEVTVYFKDNPTEPFGITEFEWLSHTRCILEELEEQLRRSSMPKTITLTFKTPDVLYYALQDIEDKYQREEIEKGLAKWIKWGEYVSLEYDAQSKTMKVLEA